MHPYATDSEERRRVPVVLGLLAILFASAIHGVLTLLDAEVPWWVDVPTPLALYAAFYSAFDRFAWRWSMWRTLRLVAVPDLDGEWKIDGTSDYQEGTRFEGEARVRQRWTSLLIEVETDRSRSRTLTAAILLERGASPELTYEYHSEPRVDAVATLQAHRGTARLSVSVDGLVGEYYGGRGSRNAGTIRFTR